MSPILQAIQARGVELRLAAGRLQARGAVTAEVRALIAEHRAELVRALTPRPALLGPGLSPELQARRWGPSATTTDPGLVVDHPSPAGLATALRQADPRDPYAAAERLAMGGAA